MQRVVEGTIVKNEKKRFEHSIGNIDNDNVGTISREKKCNDEGNGLLNIYFNYIAKRRQTEDEMIKKFFETTNLTENDKSIIELYKEKKITKQMLIKYIDTRVQPFLRGKIHLLLFCVSPLWICYMLNISKNITSKTSSLLSNFCFLYNFFASSLLHNFNWSHRQLFFIEKLDHFGIFLLICGSLFPVQFLLFEKKKLIACLVLQIILLSFGFCCTFYSYFSSGNRAVRSAIYIITGFVEGTFLKDYYLVLDAHEMFYLITLSTLYILGGIIYAIKKPTIIPGVFDFHEVFHVCCLGSAICTFALNCSVINRSE